MNANHHINTGRVLMGSAVHPRMPAWKSGAASGPYRKPRSKLADRIVSYSVTFAGAFVIGMLVAESIK